MTATHWTLDDIDWGAFDSSKVAPEFVSMVKAAALVEFNGADYTAYLKKVFPNDPELFEAVEVWGEEEVQHGRALARWAEMADPEFDFDRAFKRFTEGYSLPLDATESVRGSRCGELVARCIVETGTSSFYSVLAQTVDEPVLREIARRIAGDEFRHYKLFYSHIARYADAEALSWWGRLKVALGRIGETEDDELAYAYYAANIPETADYDRRRCIEAYLGPVYGNYGRVHIERAIAMIAKAVGVRPWVPLRQAIAVAWLKVMHWKSARFQAA